MYNNGSPVSTIFDRRIQTKLNAIIRAKNAKIARLLVLLLDNLPGNGVISSIEYWIIKCHVIRFLYMLRHNYRSVITNKLPPLITLLPINYHR